MHSYDPPALAAVQTVTKRVLAEIDRVCAVLGVRYTAYGGTAIGAVRHQGFIPWDDDGDVCMPREDYERFIREAPAVLRPEFFIASPLTDADYPISFGVIGLRGSEFVSEVAKGRSFRMPIGVDLFVLDEIADDKRVFARQSRGTWLWARLMFLRGVGNPPTGLPTPARQAASAVMLGVHFALRALRITERGLYRRWLRAALLGAEKNAAAGAAPADRPVLLGDFSTRDPMRWSATTDELFPAREVPFEDITIRVPRDHDAVLTRGYGDYMRIPEESERVNHQPFRIVLGPHADEYGEAPDGDGDGGNDE